MADWTSFEWGLSFAAATSLFIAAILGILLSISRIRVARFQNEFHKIAASIGGILASDANDSSIKLESLLVQTEAYLSSQGLPVSWREVDPLEYPQLMPLFIRCALLEAELHLLDEINSDSFWQNIAQAYDDIIFRFYRDLQSSSLDTLAQNRRLQESDEVLHEQQKKIFELEDIVQQLKMMETVSIELNTGHPPIDDITNNHSHLVDTSAQSLAMLNNIIDNQKHHIKSLEADMRRLKSGKESVADYIHVSSAEKYGDHDGLFDETNADTEELLLKISQLEMTLIGKDQELNQLAQQMAIFEDMQSTAAERDSYPDRDEQVRKALIGAWAQAEQSLVLLEQKILRQAKI